VSKAEKHKYAMQWEAMSIFQKKFILFFCNICVKYFKCFKTEDDNFFEF